MKKLIPWFVVLFLLVASSLGIYFMVFKEDVGVTSEDTDGLDSIRPRKMKIVETGATYFVVEWQTQAKVSGYLKYGDTSTSISLMAQDEEGTVPITKHRVRVGSLTPGRKYYFWVMSDNIAFGRDGRALEVLTIGEGDTADQ